MVPFVACAVCLKRGPEGGLFSFWYNWPVTDEEAIEELRFTWGVCAICGEACEEEGPMLYGKQNGRTGRNYVSSDFSVATHPVVAPVARDRSMLCDEHQTNWRFDQHKVPLNFHEYVRSHPDSHLLLHAIGVRCDQHGCQPCPKCLDAIPMEGDYLCEGCRYGFV